MAIASTIYQKQSEELLANQFTDAELLIKLNRQLNLSYDNVNDILCYLIANLDVYVAEGFILDIIGIIVGQNRKIPGGIVLDFFGFLENADKAFGEARFWNGSEPLGLTTTLSDAEYRTLILARIVYNYGNITLTGISESISLLYNTINVIVESRANAELYIRIFKTFTKAETDLIAATNLLLAPAGVTLNLVTGV